MELSVSTNPHDMVAVTICIHAISSACMECQTQSNFPAPLPNLLSPSELISNLFAWVFQLWIALVSNTGGSRPEYIYAYRCGQLCTVLSSNPCICEKFYQLKLERWHCIRIISTSMLCKLMFHRISGNSTCTVRQQKSQHWDKNTKIQVISVVTHAIACNSALFSSWSKQWGSHQEKKIVDRKRDQW